VTAATLYGAEIGKPLSAVARLFGDFQFVARPAQKRIGLGNLGPLASPRTWPEPATSALCSVKFLGILDEI